MRLDGFRPVPSIYGIEGESFEIGKELTLAVATAAERVAEAVREEVVECTKRH